MLKIDIKDKRYGSQVVLTNVQLHITSPGIYGIIGKNGQGKTTLFKCMLGLEQYIGTSELNNKVITMQDVGWCGAEPAVYDELTADEFYKFYQHLTQQSGGAKNILFDVPKDKLIREFSTGMKKKVYLNAVFQKEYSMYILDEPFNGLDIESNYYLIKYLEQLSQHCIVLVSSHIIDVLYKYCKGIFMVKNQQVVLYQQEEFSKIEGEFFQ